MGHKPRYGVQFVGYSARVIIRKYGPVRQCAYLDFVTGKAFVHAECGAEFGWVTSMRLDLLGPFVKKLPQYARELEQHLAQLSTTDSQMMTLSCGESDKIYVSPRMNVNKFIRQITKRFLEIELVLEQAQQVGSRINRRPYRDLSSGKPWLRIIRQWKTEFPSELPGPVGKTEK